jgi:acetoin utilization deacetylase AcuC-like enzyme
LHRFEHGSFWPNLRESDFHYVGEGPGLGYTCNVPLNNVGMTDADYLAVFHQVLLPMASEVSNILRDMLLHAMTVIFFFLTFDLLLARNMYIVQFILPFMILVKRN